MSKPNKSLDTREQLRHLMSQHTAMVQTPPPKVQVSPVPASVPPSPKPLEAPRPKVAGPQRTTQGERCTVRLAPQELSGLDNMILETHQRVGERITSSDVLRIGLSRITAALPITTAEIAAMRATDARRKHN